MPQSTGWWQVLQGRFTRRNAIKAGTVTVATTVAAGAATQSTSATGFGTLAERIDPARLRALDPHAAAGRWSRTQELLALQQPSGTPRLTILPIDRAKFLTGQRFDLRVEATNIDPAGAQLTVTVDNGGDAIVRAQPTVSNSIATSLEHTWRNVAFGRPGTYRISASFSGGGQMLTAAVTFQVVNAAQPARAAKNVILFIGDGMGQGPITAARIVSKGMRQGRYNGFLEMDMMDVYGHVTTSGMDSIATDSANSASAYATGHKTVVNAMGVYPDNTIDPNDDPRVENIVEMVKRARGMAVGLVTTADVADATPAAFFAHTRRRSELQYIVSEALTPERSPDVYMGGGYEHFLPQSTPDSSRKDDRNLLDEAKALGYALATTRAEMKAAGAASKLLGLFRTGNMNVYLDREVTKDAAVLGRFTDQPTLWEMTEAAIASLEQNPNGFFLMVEGASIDKQEHPLDWQRAVWDTIEMDKALGVAKKWAAQRGDTMIAVTADHNHAMTVVGTHDRDRGAGRAGNGVYDAAGFPNFIDSNGDGFPDDPNPGRTLFVGWNNHPDYRDDFELDPAPTQPALVDTATRRAAPNPARDPNAELQTGNLPFDQNNCVHTVDDVIVVASGPGADRFRGLLDNTEVFFAMVDALGLQLPLTPASAELPTTAPARASEAALVTANV